MKTIAGYTTTYNCFEMEYPVEECIRSLLGFCDEVIVVDAGSTDGTIELLKKLEREDSRVRIFVEPVDFSHPRWAIYQDGYLKAKARSHCRADFCWQTDTDEIVSPEDYLRIRRLPDLMGENKLIMLPMIEFWGSLDYVRGDFLSWKPRFSINDPRITHGIPRELKVYDAQGHEYPRPFDSDSCNYIYRDTQEGVKIVVPIPPERGDLSRMTTKQWEECYFKNLDDFPHVFHTSWLDLERKIKHYQKHWVPFHASMYNLPTADSAENNVMFEKPWSQVTESDIQSKAIELKELGPRFFHKKMNRTSKGIMFRFTRKVPELLVSWLKSKNFPTESASVSTSIHESNLDLLHTPLVSILIAVTDGCAEIERTIRSCVAQEYKNIEIVVVTEDNRESTLGPIQNILSQITHRPCRLVNKPFGGTGDCWNFGARAATGQHLVALVPGDELNPSFTRRCIEEMQANGTRMCCTQVTQGDSDTFESYQGFDHFYLRYICTVPSITIFEKSLWDSVGGFKAGLPHDYEWDFYLSCSSEIFMISNIAEKLARRGNYQRGMQTGIDPSALLSIANDRLYSVNEVRAALDMIVQAAGSYHEMFKNRAAQLPGNWLPMMLSALALEGSGRKVDALHSYIDVVRMTGEKNWLPIYRAGLLIHEGGQPQETSDFMSIVRILRPDMTTAVAKYCLPIETKQLVQSDR